MEFHSIVTDDYSLVLFHYVTRSFEEFMNRKIKNRSGQYASEFQKQLSEMVFTEPAVIEKFKEFEAHHLFDGDSPICHQGRNLRAAFKLNYHDTQEEPEQLVTAEVAEALIAEWIASAAIADPGRPFDELADEDAENTAPGADNGER